MKPNKRKKKARSGKKKNVPTLARSVEKILGVAVADQEYPGGQRRESRIMVLKDGRRVVATRRKKQLRVMQEKKILKTLMQDRCSTPALLGSNRSNILIQEEISGTRLSRALIDAEPEQRATILDAALTGLAEAQQSGSRHGLDKQFPVLGNSAKWIMGFIQQPGKIGQLFDHRPERPDVDRLAAELAVRTPRFIKWDARPGNAMLTTEGRVSWFDWEHAGVRNRLDDMAWLLSDEFTPDCASFEDDLLNRWIPEFADGMGTEEARNYLMTYSTLHHTIRLALILKNREDGEWWDLDYCVDRDKVGVTLDASVTLCHRAARWCQQTDTLSAWEPWFMEIGERITAHVPVPTSD